ncbi:hypothetical protein ACHAW6_002283 [Cyclotella cf. meneghiniana]
MNVLPRHGLSNQAISLALQRNSKLCFVFAMWSPVIQWSAVRTMIILAINQHLITTQADIMAAFVHAEVAPNEHI